ncbi:MAG TPA: GNAT family N-acetyltransferase [Thermoleophilaceae bacterium]|nr:GNAT family N-acetyltransferase [Thermoleophilaceae bacterium]
MPWDEATKAAFVEQQFTAQDTDYRRNWPNAAFDVIEVDGRPAGRLYVDRSDSELHVLDIALLPGFRGRGLGTRLLAELAEEAAGAGVPLVIYVEHQNPARRLYERLGFREVEEGPIYSRMERPPS